MAILTILAYALFGEYLPFGRSGEKELRHWQSKGPVDPSLQDIMKDAQGRLDPNAVRQEDIAAVREKAEAYRAQEQKNRAPLPLTAVAPPQRAIKVSANEHPYQRLAAERVPAPPQYLQKRILPAVMSTTKPPRWNKTLATPDPRPAPPNPFQEPPIAVNPERVAR